MVRDKDNEVPFRIYGKKIKDKVPSFLYRDVFTPKRINVIGDVNGKFEVEYVLMMDTVVFIKTEIPYRIHGYINYMSDFKGFVKIGKEYLCMDDYDKEMFDLLKANHTVDYSAGVISRKKRIILDGPLVGMEKRILGMSKQNRTITIRYDCPLVERGRILMPFRFLKNEKRLNDFFPTEKAIAEDQRRRLEAGEIKPVM